MKKFTVTDWNDRDALLRDYKRLAKVADQRLVRLESYSHDKNFNNIQKYAYARAIKDIELYSGQGAKRFNTKAPENIKTLKAKINDILNFLNSPTSTKKGVISIYKQRAESTNERYGTDFTWEELFSFIESEKYNKLLQQADSKTIMLNIGAFQKERADIVKDIRDSSDKHIKISDADVNQWIYDRLESQGINPFR